MISIVELKQNLGLSADPTKDQILQLLILAVKRYIINYCKRDFEQVQEIRYFSSPEDLPTLLLPNTPIASSPAIDIRHDLDRAFSSASIVPSDNYFVDNNLGEVEMLQPLGNGRKVIRVTYTGGYEADPNDSSVVLLPEDLKFAYEFIVTSLYHKYAKVGFADVFLAKKKDDNTNRFIEKTVSDSFIKDTLLFYRAFH